jgi:hypothetical protein
MTQQQERWRATLTSRLASPKTKRTATIGLLGSGVPLEVIRIWAKFGAKSFSK